MPSGSNAAKKAARGHRRQRRRPRQEEDGQPQPRPRLPPPAAVVAPSDADANTDAAEPPCCCHSWSQSSATLQVSGVCRPKARHASEGSWQSANVRGEEEAAAAVGGAMPKRKWCVLCLSTFLLGEASKICEVITKSLRSSYEVVTKFCANCYRTRSKSCHQGTSCYFLVSVESDDFLKDVTRDVFLKVITNDDFLKVVP